MTTHKQIEQQLKRPDSFQDSVLAGIDFLKNNPKKIAIMILPLVAVAAVGAGIYAYQQGQAGKRRTDLAKIAAMQSEEVAATAKQTEALQKEIDELRKIPAAIDPAVAPGKRAEVPAPQSAESLLKIADLEKRMAEVKPDHAGSTKAFKEYYEKNKKNAEGWMAGISWAAQQLDGGKAAEVKPVLEEITKASSTHKFYQIQSRYMLASVLEELGEFDAAIKEADVLASLVEDDAKAMALLLKGQLLYFKQDKPAARTVLSEIVDKYGSTREAQSARSLLAEIGPA